jgi:hypothetical protein
VATRCDPVVEYQRTLLASIGKTPCLKKTSGRVVMRPLRSNRLSDQVREATLLWERKGGKRGRRDQVARMMAFVAFSEGLGARDRGQLGGKTVVAFWRALRASGRSYATMQSYYYALRHLWALLELPGEVPPPRRDGVVTQ